MVMSIQPRIWFELVQSPLSSPWLRARYTKAGLVMLPTQANRPKVSSQGPMVSARSGTGRLNSLQILKKSDLNSSQLLNRNETGTSGQTVEKRDK